MAVLPPAPTTGRNPPLTLGKLRQVRDHPHPSRRRTANPIRTATPPNHPRQQAEAPLARADQLDRVTTRVNATKIPSLRRTVQWEACKPPATPILPTTEAKEEATATDTIKTINK